MLRSSYKIATIWGIPIKVHSSLLLLLFVLAAYRGMFGSLAAVRDGLILQLSVFTSIALHELGHSFVAIRKGCRVREITLLFIGGAAQMDRMPSRPMDELQMALAGPAVSLVLGAAAFFGGHRIFAGGWHYVGEMLLVVGFLNFVLAAFNLLPAFPMDGGRVLRALLSRRMGRLRATFVAARMGKILAVVLGLVAFLMHWWGPVAICFFVYAIAGNEYKMVQREEEARHGEPEFWAVPDPDWTDDDTKVIVSPPPYEKGPSREIGIGPANDSGLFGRFRR